MTPLRYLWASPNTLLGLGIAVAGRASGGNWHITRGCLEAHGGVVTWWLRHGFLFGPAAAMCLGHVILGRDQACLDHSRDHEHVHVRQYERWGPFMLPLYFGASFLAWRRGLNPYLDNPFEVEAFERG
jgi:hypothetical protein